MSEHLTKDELLGIFRCMCSTRHHCSSCTARERILDLFDKKYPKKKNYGGVFSISKEKLNG